MAFIFIIMVHEIVLSTQVTVHTSRVFQNIPIQRSGSMLGAEGKTEHKTNAILAPQ